MSQSFKNKRKIHINGEDSIIGELINEEIKKDRMRDIDIFKENKEITLSSKSV